jgi:hypothetical protein
MNSGTPENLIGRSNGGVVEVAICGCTALIGTIHSLRHPTTGLHEALRGLYFHAGN